MAGGGAGGTTETIDAAGFDGGSDAIDGGTGVCLGHASHARRPTSAMPNKLRLMVICRRHWPS